MSATVHICAPKPVAKRIERAFCPTCERWSRFTVFFYEWYGAWATCLRCGDEWSDGERLPRPFAPRWRQENIKRAKARWRGPAPSRETE